MILLEGEEGGVDDAWYWKINSHPEEGVAALGVDQLNPLNNEGSLNVSGVEEGNTCGIGA